MKIKGLVGLLAFLVCVWAVAVFTYGEQIRHEGMDDRSLQEMQNASCSSSSTSSSGQ